MGIAAIATLALYDGMFDLMGWLLGVAASRRIGGYVVYNIANHALALAIMLPATFLAGMTFPLITTALLRGRDGERAIGYTYAANTLGVDRRRHRSPFISRCRCSASRGACCSAPASTSPWASRCSVVGARARGFRQARVVGRRRHRRAAGRGARRAGAAGAHGVGRVPQRSRASSKPIARSLFIATARRPRSRSSAHRASRRSRRTASRMRRSPAMPAKATSDEVDDGDDRRCCRSPTSRVRRPPPSSASARA